MVMKCMHFNFNNTETTCTGTYEKCAKQVFCPEVDHQCFLYWQTDPTIVISAGCLKPLPQAPDEKCDKQCIGREKGSKYYCCCTEDLCNSHFKQPPPPLAEPAKPAIEVNRTPDSGSSVLWTVIPFFLMLVLITYVYRCNKGTRRRIRRDEVEEGNLGAGGLNDTRNRQDSSRLSMLIPFRTEFNHLNCHDNHDNRDRSRLNQNNITTYLTNHHDANTFNNKQQHQAQDLNDSNNNDNISIDLSSIELIEEIGSGQYGTVHKAILNESEVAVKKISSYQSWLNERQIYYSSRIKHPNILNLLYSSDEHLDESYWLILEYAPNGSLYDFLKKNVISWKEFLQICSGIVHGLSHLHESDIAHRDFKSKNILLKQDLAPCITDFGVAAVLETTNGSQLDRGKFLQAGTPRYMAPEVLEGSVTFTKASFTKIDVYALSLVLWELLSRCNPLLTPSGYQSQPAMPYKLPFEEFVGQQPDVSTMLEAVVRNKLRPTLNEEWKRNYPISEVCRTIEDGWEYDYDARISASCFVERIDNLLTCVP